jgi:hypothetical protein
MNTKLLFGLVLTGAAAITMSPGCNRSFGTTPTKSFMAIAVTDGPKGSPAEPRPLTFDVATPYTLTVTALRADGSLDTDFNGFVRISSKPGTVSSVDGPNTSGRNVQLVNGVAEGVVASLVGAYGKTRFWAEDLGYVPGPQGQTPKCADRIDNDGDGTIDFPADPGCAFANDDNEEVGTYATGVSEVLYFIAPRIADVRGVSKRGTATSFPHEQVEIDTGWRDNENYEYSTIVTRVSSDGFYATDLGETRGYASVFAFNFSAPPRMRVCDRLKTFGGTSSDFFGFTEVNFPTWTLEEWDPTQRPCLVPDPHVLTVNELRSNNSMLLQESALVRVITGGNVTVRVSKLFGPGFPAAPDYVPTENATNCDLNGDSKVDFVNEPEKTCALHCSEDAECTEFANYTARKTFRLIVSDSQGGGEPIVSFVGADGSASAQFDPLQLRGQTIKSFTGTLRYFSGGGGQFTIEGRCEDDVIIDVNADPFPSDTACVHARTIVDVNAGSN